MTIRILSLLFPLRLRPRVSEVRAFKDSEEALRGLTQRPVDLAILDIKMPRMDGWSYYHACAARAHCR